MACQFFVQGCHKVLLAQRELCNVRDCRVVCYQPVLRTFVGRGRLHILFVRYQKFGKTKLCVDEHDLRVLHVGFLSCDISSTKHELLFLCCCDGSQGLFALSARTRLVDSFRSHMHILIRVRVYLVLFIVARLFQACVFVQL